MGNKKVKVRFRRKRKSPPEIYFRQKVESAPAPRGKPYQKMPVPRYNKQGKIIGLRWSKGNAVAQWAFEVFVPKFGRFPSAAEMQAAVDSRTVSNWLHERDKPQIKKREIIMILSGRQIVVPIDRWRKETARDNKTKDMDWQREHNKSQRESRERQWSSEAFAYVLKAALRGDIDPENIDSEHDAYIVAKREEYKREQLFNKLD